MRCVSPHNYEYLLCMERWRSSQSLEWGRKEFQWKFAFLSKHSTTQWSVICIINISTFFLKKKPYFSSSSLGFPTWLAPVVVAVIPVCIWLNRDKCRRVGSYIMYSFHGDVLRLQFQMNISVAFLDEKLTFFTQRASRRLTESFTIETVVRAIELTRARATFHSLQKEFILLCVIEIMVKW